MPCQIESWITLCGTKSVIFYKIMFPNLQWRRVFIQNAAEYPEAKVAAQQLRPPPAMPASQMEFTSDPLPC